MRLIFLLMQSFAMLRNSRIEKFQVVDRKWHVKYLIEKWF